MSALWDNYKRTTEHLSMIEHGAYRLLLDYYMQTGSKLEANEKQLLRVCRAFASDEKVALLSVLAQFFELRDGAYHHADADEALAKRVNLAQVRAKAGAIGGAKSKPKREANNQANDKQLLPTSLSSSLRQKKENARPAARDSTAAPAAVGWEAEYPKWTEIRKILGETLWANWFANCRPNGAQTTLICSTRFERDKLEEQFGDKLERIFKERVTFKFEPPAKETAK